MYIYIYILICLQSVLWESFRRVRAAKALSKHLFDAIALRNVARPLRSLETSKFQDL